MVGSLKHITSSNDNCFQKFHLDAKHIGTLYISLWPFYQLKSTGWTRRALYEALQALNFRSLNSAEFKLIRFSIDHFIKQVSGPLSSL